MTDKHLGPISTLNPARAYKAYFSGPLSERHTAGMDLTLILDSGVTMSIEVLWPSILKLARQARSGDITLSDGWTIRAVNNLDAADVTFVIEHEDTPGGFLVNCRVRTEMLEDRPLEVVSQVMCCAYRADGLFPPGYSGMGNDLERTLEIGFDGRHQIGQLFAHKPSIHLQLFGLSFGKLLMPSSSIVRDQDMALRAINIVCDALTEIGLEPEIEVRADQLGKILIQHFKQSASDAHLVELGIAECRSGFISEQMISTAHHFWSQATALDLEMRAESLAASLDTLEENGFTHPGSVFSWQDQDRSAYVRRTNADEVTMWLETQKTMYRIDVKRNPHSGAIQELTVAMGAVGNGENSKPTPNERGYLGEFVRDGDGNDFSVYEIGEMTTRNIHGMDGVMYAIDGLAQELKKPSLQSKHSYT